MNILLVYPEYPDTFWSFSYALKFTSKKAAYPPLGLLTVAAMLPPEWGKRLVDMNVRKLRDKDLMWADYVFLGAMSVQKESVKAVLTRCKELGVRVVAGGPLFSNDYEDFGGVDYLVLNEAEITLPPFLNDLTEGRAERLYTSTEKADVTKTPIPLWELIDMRHYSSMNIQYSRGCPFDCEFCNITSLYGRVPRTKDSGQVLAELEKIYSMGWREGVFFVDDNFIGNKKKLKENILPSLIQWMEERKRPFYFSTEASINLADDEELMRMMARAEFLTVFVGIETPHEESLIECAKTQNRNRDLIASVKKIQDFGLEVQAGFIVGFDQDPASIFEKMITFIQESGIVTAMVGLLNAPRGTKLYKRLVTEDRLLKTSTGDNTDLSMNFVPKMSYEKLINGYRQIIETIYSPKHYYTRVKRFMKDYRPMQKKVVQMRYSYWKAGLKSVFILGVFGKERFYYWRLVFWSLFRKPKLLPMAVTFSIYGFHFRKIFERHFRRMAKENLGQT
ncbi:MAG: B12-binding domain-containing radical SAM protein [Thermodesulfovibrionales bacterium]